MRRTYVFEMAQSYLLAPELSPIYVINSNFIVLFAFSFHFRHRIGIATNKIIAQQNIQWVTHSFTQ